MEIIKLYIRPLSGIEKVLKKPRQVPPGSHQGPMWYSKVSIPVDRSCMKYSEEQYSILSTPKPNTRVVDSLVRYNILILTLEAYFKPAHVHRPYRKLGKEFSAPSAHSGAGWLVADALAR